MIFATVLRDPLDRIMSMYNYFFTENSKEGVNNPLEKARHERGEMQNYYVRKLTGRNIHPLGLYANVVRGKSGSKWEVGFDYLELAVDIIQRFEFIAVLEFLDYAESAFDFIGWEHENDQMNKAPKILTTRSSNAADELSQELLRALIAENYFDIRLYNLAVQLFVERDNGCNKK